MNDITWRSIADAPLEIIDGDRGQNYPKQDDFGSAGYCLFLNAGNVTTQGFNFSETAFISHEKDALLRKGKLKRYDVVLTTRGTVGNAAFYSSNIPYENIRINSGMVIFRPNTERLIPKFLYLIVRSEEFSKQVQALMSGSAQPQLPIRDIKKISIPLPELHEQKGVVTVIGALDDKIEVISQQVSTIKKMAQALFQSWLVNFDPVRAKVIGRQPFGLDAETAKLFPGELLDFDLGEAPAGWRATTLADIVTERTGKVGNGNEHVVLSAVATGELKRSDEHFTKQVYSLDTSKYKRVEQWDYAYNPSRINIGSIGMLEEPIVGAVSPVYTVLRPAEGYEWFLRFFLDLPQTKEVINQFCSGSVRQSLSFKDFAAIPVVLPPKEIAKAFTRRWQELNVFRQKLAMQSSKLAELRDALLPKLMSGELRVPDELMA